MTILIQVMVQGTIKVDSNITGLFPFRDALFIFCEERIFKLTGSTSSDFALQPVTREIGCINGFTIQEFAGDIVFLGQTDSEQLQVLKELATLSWVQLADLYNAVSKVLLTLMNLTA